MQRLSIREFTGIGGYRSYVAHINAKYPKLHVKNVGSLLCISRIISSAYKNIKNKKKQRRSNKIKTNNYFNKTYIYMYIVYIYIHIIHILMSFFLLTHNICMHVRRYVYDVYFCATALSLKWMYEILCWMCIRLAECILYSQCV